MTARRQFRRAIALSGLLFLGACVTPGGQDAPAPNAAATAGPPAETRAAGPVPPGPKPSVPAGFDTRQARSQAGLTRPPLPPMRPSFPRVSPTALDGIALERALTLFGKPTNVRRGPLLTTWTYAGANCALEIDFHFSVVDNAMRAHESRILGPADAGLCLHDLALPNAAIAER
jgi:hypothetical protein